MVGAGLKGLTLSTLTVIIKPVFEFSPHNDYIFSRPRICNVTCPDQRDIPTQTDARIPLKHQRFQRTHDVYTTLWQTGMTVKKQMKMENSVDPDETARDSV